MILFIDTISSPSVLSLFDSEKSLVDSLSWEGMYNEASTLLPNIKDILDRNGKGFDDLENVVVVNGPGSFTGVRTTVLLANSLAYLKGIALTDISYFEMFEEMYSAYPIIKKSTKRDSFLKRSSENDVEIILNKEIGDYLLKNSINLLYGDVEVEDSKVESFIDYSKVLERIALKKEKKIYPLYIKKPNIT